MAVDLRTSRRALVAALLVLTAVTGLIDAVSYLRMGHVFVANMTGNVVFLGFALHPGSGLSLILPARVQRRRGSGTIWTSWAAADLAVAGGRLAGR